MRDTMKYEIRYRIELLRLNLTDFLRSCIVRMIQLHDRLHALHVTCISLSAPDFSHKNEYTDPLLFYNSLSCYGTM
ncbi:MAG: hypothetical protein M0P01_04190 [Treponema sp.]|nr:hypothetical protein [Treponema sp.]